MLPVAPEREFSPAELKALAVRSGFDNFWFVPEQYLEEQGREQVAEHFAVTEQAEFKDYVYDREDLAWLKGNKYSKKRNLINQFKKQYLDEGRVEVEPVRSAAAEECLEFLEQWCVERDCDAVPEERTWPAKSRLSSIPS